MALPFIFSFENRIHQPNPLIIQYSSFHALFTAYYCGFLLVRKFYSRKRDSQRYTANNSGILALDSCFDYYLTFFTGTYRSSKGFNSSELENSCIVGDPIRHQFQHVYIHGAKIIYGNKHCFDKLNDTHIYRIGFLD